MQRGGNSRSLVFGKVNSGHVVWRDSVGVESSGSGLKIRVRGYFSSELSLVVTLY